MRDPTHRAIRQHYLNTFPPYAPAPDRPIFEALFWVSLPSHEGGAARCLEHALRPGLESVAGQYVLRRAVGADLWEDRPAARDEYAGDPGEMKCVVPEIEEKPVDLRPSNDRKRAGRGTELGPSL